MIASEPVVKEIVVAASQRRAFEVFTDRIDAWWPRTHHVGKSPLARAVLEPRAGGRWVSLCEDDSECDIGKVLDFDPPRRLLLAWQIDADWQYDPAFVTEVEVRFVELGPRKTRVVLEHRNLDRYGVREVEVSTSIGSPGGWPSILRSYADLAASLEAA
jgi:uncharacterized protein YndB with AHSA1/START domain